MRVFHWNCHGLARAAAVRTLRAWIGKLSPDVIFLVETKIGDVSSVFCRLGFSNFVQQPSVGRKGGLTLAWRAGVDLEVSAINQSFINALIFSDPRHVPWMLTLVYGPSIWSDKPRFWEQLRSVGQAFNGAWMCLGDFNSVISQQDKSGGIPVHPSSSVGLGPFLLSQGMIDLGFHGPPFTWSNKRHGQALIRERLDWGVANGAWRLLFPRATIKHCPRTSSDHAPILMDTFGDHLSGPRPFRFEPFWVSSPQCYDVVDEAWSISCLGSPTFRITQKIKNVKE